MSTLEGSENLRRVSLRRHVLKHFFDDTVRAHDHGRPSDPLAPLGRTPDAVGIAYLVPVIAKQWEVQGELFTECLMAGAVVGAHAEDAGLSGEVRRGVAELLAFDGAT